MSFGKNLKFGYLVLMKTRWLFEGQKKHKVEKEELINKKILYSMLKEGLHLFDSLLCDAFVLFQIAN